MDNHPHTTEEYLVIACRQYAESHKDQFMPRATLWQAADTIERLQKENDRLRQPRCINEPAGDPCKFCGAREDTDVCRDGTAHIIRERDAALAEVERLKARITAADHRLSDLKGLHTVWYLKPICEIEPDEEAKIISKMEQIAFSTHCYLEGNPGPYLEKVGEK